MRTAHRLAQQRTLSAGLAADHEAQRRATAELVARLAGSVVPAQVGQALQTVGQMAREVGFADTSPGDLGARVRTSGGRAYR